MRVDEVAEWDMQQANRYRWRPDYEGVELGQCRCVCHISLSLDKFFTPPASLRALGWAGAPVRAASASRFHASALGAKYLL